MRHLGTAALVVCGYAPWARSSACEPGAVQTLSQVPAARDEPLNIGVEHRHRIRLLEERVRGLVR